MSAHDKSLTPGARGEPDRHAPSSSVAVLRAIIEVTRLLGVPTSTFLSRLGVSADDLKDPERRIPFALLIKAWALGPELSGDAYFGVRFGERAPDGVFDTMDYATRSSATLGEAIERLVRYQRLVHSVAVLSLEREKEVAHLVNRIRHPPVPGLDQSVEASLSLYLMRSRAVTASHIIPVSVQFAHAAPQDTSEHHRVFGVEPHFDSDCHRLTFRAADMELPVVSADQALLQILDRHADATVARLPPRGGISARVARAVADAMRGEVPRLSAIARQLGMSGRSLQRKLEVSGDSYSAIVDEVRCKMAQQYLDESDLAVGEIAYLLGFSEQSAFYRAFRRWTGTTPQSHRNRQTAR